LPGLGGSDAGPGGVRILGLLLAFRGRKPGGRLQLLWVALFPVSAAMTTEGLPHALRSHHGRAAAAALPDSVPLDAASCPAALWRAGRQDVLVLVRVFFS
jgi:hypothetical protein